MIECVNSGSNKLITVGKKYEIIYETENRYTILNDKGIQKNYSKNLFEIEGNKIVDEINIETHVNINLDEIEFLVRVKIDGFEDFDYGGEALALVKESNISCGIKQLSGIDDIMQFENRFRNDFKDYIRENGIELDNHIDLDELCDETISSLFQDLIAELDGTCLYTLLSTNLNNNGNYNQKVVDILNGISENEVFIGENPNSGNEIQLWIIKCN